ncbi:ABC transporter permease subunit [Alkalibaculum sp. M08DMB]|uniref:ABC transporter permease subunit n=1 Tax=Alkalibaculum sporogenes TaxID=2655001 RepID=A0A6A7K507_9FIRM|nr:ABC transporter permease subunit [Alkalibaculum sporogenes]
MITLIRQELYKLFMRKKTFVVLIGLILLTGFITYGFKSNAENMKKYDTPEFQIENIESNIIYLETEKNNIPQDIESDEVKTSEYLEDLDREINQLESEKALIMSTIGEDIDWRDTLDQKIKQQEKMILEDGANVNASELAQMNLQLDELQYLRDNQIEPQEYHDFNGFIFINQLISTLGQVFLFIGIAVFAADMVSGECTPPTLKLLLAQPVSRGKVILSKFIAIVIASVSLIILVEILAFIFVGMIYGFGDSSYPSIVGTAYQFDTSIFLENGGHPLTMVPNSGEIIPVWQYTIKLFLIQGLFIVTITSFVFMISTLVKSSMVSMGTSVVSLIAATIIFQFSALQRLGKYFFTSYSSLDGLITGNIAMYYNNPSMTGSLGIIVNVGWIILCYLVAHTYFIKKDFLI